MPAIDYRLFMLLFGSLIFSTSATIYHFHSDNPIQKQQELEVVSHRESIEVAKSIVVQIKVNRSSGSGILIQKTNNIYTVITNRHVVDRGNKYQIQAPDNNFYQGKLVAVSSQDDLAILQFVSEQNYPIAKINNSTIQLKENLFAVGFPYNSDRLKITRGQVFLLASKPLKQGYQIGYSNNIYKGMSGGAIINQQGEVVGVNGRSANPIIPNYQFQDDTYPDEKLQQQMMTLSWGIPIQKAINFLSTIEITNNPKVSITAY